MLRFAASFFTGVLNVIYVVEVEFVLFVVMGIIALSLFGTKRWDAFINRSQLVSKFLSFTIFFSLKSFAFMRIGCGEHGIVYLFSPPNTSLVSFGSCLSFY